MGGEGCNNDAGIFIICIQKNITKHISCNLFRWGFLFCTGIKCIYYKSMHSLGSKLLKLCIIRLLSDDWGIVKLKVIGIDHWSFFVMNRDNRCLQRRMRHMEEFHFSAFNVKA